MKKGWQGYDEKESKERVAWNGRVSLLGSRTARMVGRWNCFEGKVVGTMISKAICFLNLLSNFFLFWYEF